MCKALWEAEGSEGHYFWYNKLKGKMLAGIQEALVLYVTAAKGSTNDNTNIETW